MNGRLPIRPSAMFTALIRHRFDADNDKHLGGSRICVLNFPHYIETTWAFRWPRELIDWKRGLPVHPVKFRLVSRFRTCRPLGSQEHRPTCRSQPNTFRDWRFTRRIRQLAAKLPTFGTTGRFPALNPRPTGKPDSVRARFERSGCQAYSPESR
jgi:hypothetical protein